MEPEIAPTYRIEWDGESRPDLEQQLRDEIAAFADDDEVPEALVFHTTILGDDMEGPSIFSYWDDERKCVVARFSDNTEWTSLDDLEKDDVPPPTDA